MNTLIHSHAPLKRLSKIQRKFLQKPWITKGKNSIKKKFNKKSKIQLEKKYSKSILNAISKSLKRIYMMNTKHIKKQLINCNEENQKIVL